MYNVKLGKKVNQRLEGLISSAIYQRFFFRKGDFFWKNMSYTTKVRSHSSENFRRNIEEIAPKEIALALITCVKNSLSILDDDLIKEVAIVFGFKATEKVSEKIRLIYHQLLSQQYFTQVNGRVSINHK